MKSHKRFALWIVIGLLTGLILVGCAAPAIEEPAAEEAAPAEEEVIEAELAMDEAYADDVAVASTAGDSQAATLPQDRMIIKNGEISLLVENTSASIDRVTQVATDNGGYVVSSQVYMEGEYQAATLTIAVRSDKFETAMNRLRLIALEVLRESSTGEDVTGEYVDLESRLRNLEATRDRIRTFLDEAKDVEESLDVNRELSEIEAEIEQVKGRMEYLSGRSAFSTITVDIHQAVNVTPTPTPPWSASRVFKNAAESQSVLFRGLIGALIWIVVVPGPYIAAGLIVFFVVRRLARNNGQTDAQPESEDNEHE